jgi:hypothetical protein
MRGFETMGLELDAFRGPDEPHDRVEVDQSAGVEVLGADVGAGGPADLEVADAHPCRGAP